MSNFKLGFDKERGIVADSLKMLVENSFEFLEKFDHLFPEKTIFFY